MMRGYGLYNGYGMMGGGGLGMLFIGLLWLLFVVGIVVLVVVMVRRAAGHSHGGMMHGMQGGMMGGTTPVGPAHDEAVAIARRRLASGEITKEQFDELMQSLG
jgi:uncharacterized membrane protein